MESINNSETIQQIKDEFEEWLQKFHDDLSKKNQSLKSYLKIKQQRNNELKMKIEELRNDFEGTITIATNVIPHQTVSQLKENLNNIKIKAEQLNKCTETINTKVEEETKKMRSSFFELITRDDIALKPYHEVEKAIQELANKTDAYKRKENESKEKLMKHLKESELYYNEIKQIITTLEPLEQEMRSTIKNCNMKFEEKLKLLNLNSIEEANDQSNEAMKLRDEISNMKLQLNIE